MTNIKAQHVWKVQASHHLRFLHRNTKDQTSNDQSTARDVRCSTMVSNLMLQTQMFFYLCPEGTCPESQPIVGCGTGPQSIRGLAPRLQTPKQVPVPTQVRVGGFSPVLARQDNGFSCSHWNNMYSCHTWKQEQKSKVM